jgi:hypothetical protein
MEQKLKKQTFRDKKIYTFLTFGHEKTALDFGVQKNCVR